MKEVGNSSFWSEKGSTGLGLDVGAEPPCKETLLSTPTPPPNPAPRCSVLQKLVDLFVSCSRRGKEKMKRRHAVEVLQRDTLLSGLLPHKLCILTFLQVASSN